MKNKKDSNLYKVKFIIVGDSFVGKTNIFNRYIKGEFANNLGSTISVEFQVETIQVNDAIFRLQLWDTAGSEKFRSIVRGYYADTACCLLVYDITNQKSFDSLDYWIEEIKNNSHKNVEMILIGNKCDKENERQIEETDGEFTAERYGMKFFESSALTGYNIKEIFEYGCKKVYENIVNGKYDLDNEDHSCGVERLDKNKENNLNPAQKIKFTLQKDNVKKKKKKKKFC